MIEKFKQIDKKMVFYLIDQFQLTLNLTGRQRGLNFVLSN